MILIKSTSKMFICLFVRFYLFLKLQFLLGFLIPWNISVHLYCVCQILAFSAINTIVTDMKGNTRIVRLPLGHLYIIILPSISVTIIQTYFYWKSQLSRGNWLGSHQPFDSKTQICACPKPAPEFPSTNIMVFFVFNDLR
jgi:hypothetical protein